MRKRLPDAIELPVDYNQALTVAEAIRRGRSLEGEPEIVRLQILTLRRLRGSQIRQPVTPQQFPDEDEKRWKQYRRGES